MSGSEFILSAPLGYVIGSILLTEGLNGLDSAMEFEDVEKCDTIVVHIMKYDKALWKGTLIVLDFLF